MELQPSFNSALIVPVDPSTKGWVYVERPDGLHPMLIQPEIINNQLAYVFRQPESGVIY